ncbi:hypothetical protein GCM10027592_11400 [Spirosoma flavus]
MKHISYWASRHKTLAIALIILGEFFNAFNGISLGATVLESFPLRWLQWGMWLLLAAVIVTYRSAFQAATDDFWRRRTCLALAFFANFLFFGLLGGTWGHQSSPAQSTQQVLGSRRIEVVRDTLESGNSLRSENHADRKVNTSDEPENAGGRRIGYVLLALLGVAGAYIMAALACNILCAGYGFIAALTLYAGMGGLAAAIYYLKRTFQRRPKRRRDMTPDERKRDLRVFWFSWLAFAVAATVIILTAGGK